jgi:phytoene dehydrogenase-like protein
MKFDISLDCQAVVVGSGINGLAAAAELAGAGLKVLVIEGNEAMGGCTRSDELTLPGYLHDIGSAVFPMAAASPFFNSHPFSEYGLKWIKPPVAIAHPFADGTAALLYPSVEETAETLGGDSHRYRELMSPLLENWDALIADLVGTFRLLQHPFKLMSFGAKAFRSATNLAGCHFTGSRARGFISGLCAHSVIPLEHIPSAAFGIVLGLAGHAVGWPIPKGGSGKITQAILTHLDKNNIGLITGHAIRSLDELPKGTAQFLDITPRQFLSIAGTRLSGNYGRMLKQFRYGPGVFKMDWAISEPIPWKAKECLLAGTVHVGGSMESVALSEREIWQNKAPPNPFVIVAQPTLFDDTRAPKGKHIAWAYCHIPNGFPGDMTAQIEAQIERFAPGFREIILARSIQNTTDLERLNPNLVGGDITGGAQVLSQIFTRPALRWDPYATPIRHVYLCSASTPPGAGVHGMCGAHAAASYLGTL